MVLKNLFTGQQWRNRLENRLTDMGRGKERVRCRKGEGEMYGKSNMETHITIY